MKIKIENEKSITFAGAISVFLDSAEANYSNDGSRLSKHVMVNEVIENISFGEFLETVRLSIKEQIFMNKNYNEEVPWDGEYDELYTVNNFEITYRLIAEKMFTDIDKRNF